MHSEWVFAVLCVEFLGCGQQPSCGADGASGSRPSATSASATPISSAPSVPRAAAAAPLWLPILMAIDEGKIEPSSFAKGSDVDDHPFVGVYGETYVVTRLESPQ